MGDLTRQTAQIVDRVAERIRAVDARRLEHLRKQSTDLGFEIERLEARRGEIENEIARIEARLKGAP